MNGVTDGSAFLVIWIGFTLLMLVVVTLIFYWGIRTRQFSDQDRARFLPLDDSMRQEWEAERPGDPFPLGGEGAGRGGKRQP